jgi:outer membrane protein, multidrug efflux system
MRGNSNCNNSNENKGTPMRRFIFLASAAALLGACALPPELPAEPAALPLPERYAGESGGEVAAKTALDASWWQAFGSAELDALIARVHAQNLDLVAAAARMRQAEAAARVASAGLWPEISLSLEGEREARLGGHGHTARSQTIETLLITRYEADFWGGRRAAETSAHAALRASRFDRDTVRLSLTAASASTWLEAVALHERSAMARLNLGDAERLLALVQSRWRAGAATPLEVSQQRSLVAAQRRALAALEQAAAQAERALDLWLGEAGGAAVVARSLVPLREPAVGAGLPSQLLTRRPDVARAEAQLRAAEADVLRARAALLPSLTLSAGLGFTTGRVGPLLDEPIHQLTANLVAPVFSAGRLRAGHAGSQARQQELLAAYRQAIVAAFSDVQSALLAREGLERQRLAQAAELEQAQLALALARARYRAGGESLLTLLDAQRTVYAAQDQAVQLRLAVLQAAVALYRALGGGWDSSTEQEVSTAAHP